MDTSRNNSTPALDAEIDPVLEAKLARAIAETGVPGASVSVWHRGRWSAAAAGMVNFDTAVAADVDSVFQIGSITKAFTATMILMLRDEGLLGLDDPVACHLPGFRVADAAPPASLTIRTLLDYTSGIAGDFFADLGPDPTSLARYVDACASLPLLFAPGTMRGYSSTAYCVAGRIVEAVTGRFYEDVLRERLLLPLGMRRFGFYTHDIARFRTAVGHEATADGAFKVMKELRLPHCMSASGASLTMTATDLMRFALLHLPAEVTARGTPLIRASSCEEMRDGGRRLPPNDTPVLMGWASVPIDGGALICASGQTVGQNAVVAFSPEREFALSILANVAGGAQRLLVGFGDEIMSEEFGARLRPMGPGALEPREAGHLARYWGTYTNHTRATVLPANAALALEMTARNITSDQMISQTLALTPVGEDRFVIGEVGQPGGLVQFLFQRGEEEASHFALGGSLYARCDADGRVAVC